ncbi:MAG: SCO family protein [Deltaproteobacteria bacterium]|nr:SCO family protein [Deltaproteobacteria bacterium]
MENSEPDQRTPIYRNPFVWAAFIGMVLVTLMRPLLRHVPEPPPVIAQLPAFTLTDQNGRDFGSADLAGHVYVANFIFTSCPSYCPKLTKAMKFLQDRYADAGHDVRLVSFSVDPKRDTPEVLKRYGEKYGADFSRWTFLTGTEENLRAIIVDGFKAHFGPRRRRWRRGRVAHGNFPHVEVRARRRRRGPARLLRSRRGGPRRTAPPLGARVARALAVAPDWGPAIFVIIHTKYPCKRDNQRSAAALRIVSLFFRGASKPRHARKCPWILTNFAGRAARSAGPARIDSPTPRG